MIVVNAVVSSSEEDIAAMKEAIASMEAASRDEAGCLDYTFSTELNNPAVMRITEKWENIEALQAHFQTPHMQAFQASMGERPPASLDVKFYQVEEVHPF